MLKKTTILLLIIFLKINCYSQKKINNIILDYYPSISLPIEISYCNKSDTTFYLNFTTSINNIKLYNFDYNHTNLYIKYKDKILSKKDTLLIKKKKKYKIEIKSIFPHQIQKEIKFNIKTKTAVFDKNIKLYFLCYFFDIKELKKIDTIILSKEKCCFKKNIIGFINFGETTNIKIYDNNDKELLFETYYNDDIFYINMQNFNKGKYKLIYESFPYKFKKNLLIN